MRTAEGLKRLVEQARSDPAFFHALVFNPEKVISGLDYLDRKTKGALLQIDADVLIRNLIPDIVAECGTTCSGNSCGLTCGAGSCIDTCTTNSCGTTCGSSCDKTSVPERVIIEDPLVQAQAQGAAPRAAQRRTRRTRGR